MSAQKIAFILGGGDLARTAISYCHDKHYEIYIIALTDNCESDALDTIKDQAKEFIWCRLEKAGPILTFLKKYEIDKAVMIGAVKRPSFWQLKPDFTAIKIILKNLIKIFGGDDSALRIIKTEILKRSGARLIGLHEVWPEICAPLDLSIGKPLSAQEKKLVKKGWLAAKKHGEEDKGQSICIFPSGTILKESKKGTDALIISAKEQGGFLIKTSKPQQDLTLDMPTIGPRTIETLAQHGFKAAVIEAGRTIIHDREQVFSLCTKHEITLMALTDEQARAL
jgi:hypothetical protein